MGGTELVTQIIAILVAGIKGIATGIGQGISELVNNIFFTTTGDTQTMSAFAILVCVFAGISLAIGLSRKVVGWLGSLGGRSM